MNRSRCPLEIALGRIGNGFVDMKDSGDQMDR